MEIEIISKKDVRQWYAKKINKEVSELDQYDLFCAKVAFDFVSEFDFTCESNETDIKQMSTPKHYNNGKDYDVIDFCQDYGLNFNRGSAIKYIARAGKKDNEIVDLYKAIDFLQREIKYLEKNINK